MFSIISNYLIMAVVAAAWCAIIILSITLLIYLLRIARWYINKNQIPPLFGRKNKKNSEE